MSSKKDREPGFHVELQSPSNGSASGTNTPIRFRASAEADSPNHIVRTGVAIRNGNILVEAPTFVLDTDGVVREQGSYKIYAYAYDNLGDETESGDRTLHIHGGADAPTRIDVLKPDPNSVHRVGDRIDLKSSVSYPGGRRIVKVEYYTGETIIGEPPSAPYNSSWTPTAPNEYIIRAEMTMDDDEVITDQVRIEVEPIGIILDSPKSGNVFQAPAPVPVRILAGQPVAGRSVTRIHVFDVHEDGETKEVHSENNPTFPLDWSWTDPKLGLHVGMYAVAILSDGTTLRTDNGNPANRPRFRYQPAGH